MSILHTVCLHESRLRVPQSTGGAGSWDSSCDGVRKFRANFVWAVIGWHELWGGMEKKKMAQVG